MVNMPYSQTVNMAITTVTLRRCQRADQLKMVSRDNIHTAVRLCTGVIIIKWNLSSSTAYQIVKYSKKNLFSLKIKKIRLDPPPVLGASTKNCIMRWNPLRWNPLEVKPPWGETSLRWNPLEVNPPGVNPPRWNPLRWKPLEVKPPEVKPPVTYYLNGEF